MSRSSEPKEKLKKSKTFVGQTTQSHNDLERQPSGRRHSIASSSDPHSSSSEENHPIQNSNSFGSLVNNNNYNPKTPEGSPQKSGPSVRYKPMPHVNKEVLNSNVEAKTGCTISSSHVDFINVPVRTLDDQTNFETSTFTLINNSKEKYFWKLDPPTHSNKYNLVITPTSGKLGRLDKKNAKNTVIITIQVQAFCTTRINETISISLIPKQDKGTLFRRSSSSHSDVSSSSSSSSENLKSLFVSLYIESELSTSIDYDEIEFISELSSGGWGTVHRGKWRELEIAVKKLHIQELTIEQKEEVLREQNLLKKLACPFVVTYIGSTQIPGQPICILMEFVKEGSLAKLLRGPPITDRLKTKILLDIAMGMKFLHYNHFYHRDLKPDNVLVVSPHENASVTVKITDFDTARYYNKKSKYGVESDRSDYQTFQQYGSVDSKDSQPERAISKGLGTLEYKAPEVIQGLSKYSLDKSDTFSYGVLIWQVFTQKVPYADAPFSTMTPHEIEEFVVAGKRLEIPSSIYPGIKILIEECWDQNPNKRPEFKQIAETLQQILEEMNKENQLQERRSSTGSTHVSQVSNKDEADSRRRKSDTDTKSGRNGSSLLRSSSGSTGSGSAPDSPIPPKNIQYEIGWAGNISREASEDTLKTTPKGSFLLRWSNNVRSYVLSYNGGSAGIVHIKDIKPYGTKGKVKVIKEDNVTLTFDSLADYVYSMKKQGTINTPICLEETRNPYQQSPEVLYR